MSAEMVVETLTIDRTFNASIDRVFEAWSKPELLSSWFGPDGFKVVKADVDFRVNGKYNIQIESPEQTIIKHFGEYVEIDNPNTIVFTWVLENQVCQGSEGQKAITLVELNFVELTSESTLLQLKHDKLPDQAARDGHHFGWSSSLDCLTKVLES